MAINNKTPIDLSGINVGIIMDGNGRWAKKNHLNVSKGHEKGVETVRQIVERAAKAQLESLSLYAFSTENWSRPKNEILGIKKLIISAINSQVPDLVEQKISLNFFGDFLSFGPKVIQAIEKAQKDTQFNEPNLQLNIALGYGGRQEIIDAIKSLVIENKGKDPEGLVEEINDEQIREHLYLPDAPDVDLVIRTSGESRLSGFLLWQSTYSEFVFQDVYWPEFRKIDFLRCLREYTQRERRFGK